MKTNIVSAYNEYLDIINIDRKLCRLISGEYYISNKSCFEMSDGSWHRINNGKICYNIDTKKWVFKTDNLQPVFYKYIKNKFLIGFTEKNNTNYNIINLNPDSINRFIVDDYKSTIYPKYFDKFHTITEFVIKPYLENYQTYFLISNDVIKKASLEKRIFDNTYCYPFNDLLPIINRKSRHHEVKYSRDLNYNIKESSYFKKEAEKKFKDKELGNNYDEIYKKYFNNKTFGVEIETSSGSIPENEMLELGFVPLRDGSLNGGIEYTSIVFNSGKGIKAMDEFYKLVQKYCFTSEHCSFHIHFGGMPRTRLFGLAYYKLCYRLQEELFDLVPLYKKELRYWNSKRRSKDHCQSLKSLNINLKSTDTDEDLKREFNKLFTFVSEGTPESDRYNFENKKSPKEGAAKWNLNSRYYWMNFVNYFFTPQETLEYRIFESSLDFNTSFYYMMISLAILNYAEKNQNKIVLSREKIILEDVLEDTFDKDLSDEIITFIYNKRKLNFDDFIKDDIYASIKRENDAFNTLTNDDILKLESNDNNNIRIQMNYSKNLENHPKINKFKLKNQRPGLIVNNVDEW